MLFRIASAALHGIEAYPVEVEVDISAGFPTFVTVGLPDAAVRESKERVRAALKNCGYDLESKRITINLAPADRRKEGSAFDLPIALGFLAFLDVVPAAGLGDHLFVGELALDGRLKPVRGALPIALMARERGCRGLVLPGANAREAALVRGLDVYALEDIVRVVRLLREPGSVGPSRFEETELLAPAA
jgi:magnesium chelatase family protein